MSITLTKNGKYFVRLQIPKGERNAQGKMKHKNITKTCDTEAQAKIWERQKNLEHKKVGTDNMLLVSELAEFREAKKLARNEDLRAVAEFWSKHHPQGEILTVRQVWERYESSEEFNDYKPRTRANKKTGIVKLCKEMGDAFITEVSVDDFENYLGGFKDPLTRNTNMSTIRTMWDWACARKQGYLKDNQLKLAKRANVAFKPVKIGLVGDTEKLLNKCLETDANLIPFIVLQYLGGVRTSEIEGDASIPHSRLEARDFDFESKTIFIRPEVAKTQGIGKEVVSARLIENLPDALWTWLGAVNFDGNVDITNRQKRISNLYSAADVPFPKNVGRHSFASYAYALWGEAGKVCKVTGHSEAIMRRYYTQLVKKSDGVKYFDIKPSVAVKKRKARQVKGATKVLTDDTLLELSKVMNNSQIARAYAVSESSIRKRLGKMV